MAEREQVYLIPITYPMKQAIDILDEMLDKIEDFKYHEDTMDNEYYRGRHEQEINTLNEIKSRIQALGDGWIRIDDELPKEEGVYLIYSGEVCEGRYDGTWNFYTSYDNYSQPVGLTHWKPLVVPNL